MRIVVDYALCESNAVCMRLVPEVFEVRDDDRLYLRMERPRDTLRPRVEEAVRRCPKQALSLVDV
jgi:ferredoxin